MATTGTASLNFGAAPGGFEANVVITGQAGILAGSYVECFILPATTADHSNDEHVFDPPRVAVGTIVPGVGFTIYGFAANPVDVSPINAGRDGILDSRSVDQQARTYGVWNIGWVWV